MSLTWIVRLDNIFLLACFYTESTIIDAYKVSLFARHWEQTLPIAPPVNVLIFRTCTPTPPQNQVARRELVLRRMARFDVGIGTEGRDNVGGDVCCFRSVMDRRSHSVPKVDLHPLAGQEGHSCRVSPRTIKESTVQSRFQSKMKNGWDLQSFSEYRSRTS